MFREIKNIEKKLTEEEKADILARAEYGVISTIGEDGYPYGVPVNFVYEDGRIWFHCNPQGHKVDNIKFSDKVSFCAVVDTEVLPQQFNTRYKSVIAFGRVTEATGDEKTEGFMKIIEKFSKEFKENGKKYVANSGHQANVYYIDTEYVTAKGKR